MTAILVYVRILKIKDAKSFFFGFSSLIRTMEVEIVRTKITLACTECKQRNYNTTKDDIVKQTIAVISSSIVLGIIISILDFIFKFLLNFVLK